MATSKSLTAADVMQANVISASSHTSLKEALDLMVDNHITGLPVLDRKDRCIGVISSSDILSYEQDHSELVAEANEDLARVYNQETQRWESLRLTSFALEEFADLPVSEIMSSKPISVQKEMALSDVAHLMVEENVHRVLVLDEDNFLLGIISAFDFVRVTARS